MNVAVQTFEPAARVSVFNGRAEAAIDVEVGRDRAFLARIGDEWLAVEDVSSGADFFQGFAWACAVFAFEEKRSNAAFAPVIVTARQRGRLVAVLPLECVASRMRRALVPLGNGYAQYSGIVAVPGIDLAATFDGMLKAAVAETGADVVQLRKLRSDCPLYAALPPTAFAVGPPAAAPAVELSAWANFNDYYKALKPKTRKAMRNARNRLERDGVVSHAVSQSCAERIRVVERTLAGRSARLKDQGLTSRAFADDGFGVFCGMLAEGGAGFPVVLSMSLRHGDREIAEQWGFVHQGRYYAYMATRDFELSEASPGKLHLKDIIEEAYARGLHTVDLLVPAMPYKLTWASAVVGVQDFALPMTAKGRIVTRVFDGLLRPLAKQALVRLPRRARQFLTDLAGR